MTDQGATIPVGGDTGYAWKAEECLRLVNRLPRNDLAKPELLAAAQTFAILHLADVIGTSGSGYNLVEATLAAGKLQP